MQEEYLRICGMPTKVITWGKSVHDEFEENEPKDIVICFPGNPGLTTLYVEFLKTIHEQVGYPVWIIGHAGHEVSDDVSEEILPLKDNEKIYGVEGQISYKLAFIEKYVPKDARIHFIGHSFGTYIILQLLKTKSIRSRAIKSYLLYPAVENLAETPNGKFVGKAPSVLMWILLLYVRIFTLIPFVLRKLLIQMILLLFFIPTVYADSIVKVIQTDILSKVYALALDEMATIKECNSDVLKQNKGKIKLYYGNNDGWAPLSNYAKLKKDIPNIDAEVCNCNIGHNFVFKHSNEMGNIVANWIKSN